MKKSLLTLAVAAGMAASGAAFADVTTYGHAQVEIGTYGGDVEGIAVADAARGRIGFKASEDLGDGMKAITKMEFKVDTADGDAGAASCKATDANAATSGTSISCSGSGGISLQKREQLVGLKTGMGTVELGRLKSAYKYFGGVKYDPFVASLLEARGNGGMSGKVGKGNAYGHNSFISDSFGYSHKVGAASFRLTYDFDDGGPATTATGANGMTFGFKFATKAFEVVAAIANDGEAGTSEYSATKFGGQFKGIKGMKISAQVESAEKGTEVTDQ